MKSIDNTGAAVRAFFVASLAMLFYLTACQKSSEWDAYGNFEAAETIISAETDGQIMVFDLQEGQPLQKNQWLGYIDTTQLHLSKQQLWASARATITQRLDVQAQLEVLYSREKSLRKERQRLDRLLEKGAVSQQQLNQLEDALELVGKEIIAQRSQLQTKNASVQAAADPVYSQIKMIDDRIRRSHILNPVEGVALKKYAGQYEFAYAGRPLYKVADLSELTLRVFLSGTQLPGLRLGQAVQVYIDEGPKAKRVFPGSISWISSKAEFTPKNIQTKEERVNQVYAVKIRVPNDGTLKIGMYGEVKF